MSLLMMRDVPRASCPKAARATMCRCKRGARGVALRLPLAADSIDDAARFLRDILFRRPTALLPIFAQECCTSARRGTGGCTRRRRPARCS